MNLSTAIKLLVVGLALGTANLVRAQTDVAVRVRIAQDAARAGESVYATVYLTNEGDELRRDLRVELRPTPGFEFGRLDTNTANAVSGSNYHWSVPSLPAGASDSLRFTLRTSVGGVHTVVAELIAADLLDWDSEANNDRPEEDDQSSACLSVPLEISCGRVVVLRAPPGFAGYSWTRDGQPMPYATGDTLHPSRTGAYAYQIEGATCTGAGGNCCPVLIERAGCATDLALRITADTVDASTRRQLVRIRLFNQGTTTVTRADLYVTLTNRMRVSQALPRWTYRDTRMTTEWSGNLVPGAETELSFEVQAVGSAAAADYRMFAEISAAYAGGALLNDIDSRADLDSGNDLIVDDAIALLSTRDEDDSDVVDLRVSQPVMPGCELTVFAQAAYLFTDRGTEKISPRLCLLPTNTEVAALTFKLDGSVVQLAPATCAEQEEARFSLASLGGEIKNSRYLIKNYRAGGSTGISRRVVGSLAELLDALRAVDPGARISYDVATRRIRIASATLRPARLDLFHYGSRKSISLTPDFEQSAAGAGVYLPLRLAGGLHTLEAFDAAGCRTSTRLEIQDNRTNRVRYDTVRATVEVGEPFVARTPDGERTVDARWTQLTTATWVATFGTIGERVTSSFAKDRAAPGELQVETTYQLSVVERACTPLMSDTPRTKLSSTCAGSTFALGLLRPDLQVRSAGSRVLSTSTPTGMRDASSYDLGQLPQRGLSQDYEVVDWVGVPAATGLRGHLGQIAAQLRRRGVDVDIDWSTGELVAGGVEIGSLELREIGVGTAHTLGFVSQSQPTYGEIYARVGNNYVDLSLLGGCEQLLTLKLKCQNEFFYGAGRYNLLAGGSPRVLSLSDLGIPDTHANWKIANPPTKVRVRRSADGSGVELTARAAGADELTLRACDDNGDCFLSKIALQVSAQSAAAKPVTHVHRESVTVGVGDAHEWCLPSADESKRVVRVVNRREQAAGERAAVEWVSGTCLGFEGVESGEERMCILRSYGDGSRDSIAVLIRITPARKALALEPDAQSVAFGEYSLVEVLDNDQLSDGSYEINLVSEPFFGRAQVVGNQQIEYTHYGNGCSPDVFTYAVCQGSVCDSATVELDVYCEQVLVYNGLSPNGDGVNDEFQIYGLERFPNHELRIFDARGRLLYRTQRYANDWRGELGGQPLREATYYYVLEFGDGGAKSGYLQLTR